MRAGRISGKVVLVTGAAQGIGFAMARLFAAEGATVVLADIDAPHGRAAALTIDRSGGVAEFVRVDVTDEASVTAALALVQSRFGRLDALVNTAGGSTMRDGAVTQVALDEWWRTLRTDLFGTFLCARHALPMIVASGGGAIVNMGSILAERGVAGRDAYTAAKGGVHALTRSMAVEFAAQNVRVNCIAPGAVLSERVERFIHDDPLVQATIDKHLLGVPEPDEIALLALYLVSDESRRMTGAVIPLDGGRAAG